MTESIEERRAFAMYLADCDAHAIVPDVAGAFAWAWRKPIEAAVKQAREALKHCLAVLERANCAEGYCCCGSAMESHTFGDGHSPIDMGDYAQSQAMASARAAIESLKGKP